jgi:hypothetical protein
MVPASALAIAPPLHTSPATRHWVPPGAAGNEQIPRVAPDCLVQMPPQQSVSLEQVSPVWVQKDGLAEQVPFVHTDEQQSPLAEQVLPDVLQVVLSG